METSLFQTSQLHQFNTNLISKIAAILELQPGKVCGHLTVNADIKPSDALSIKNDFNYQNQRPLNKTHSLVLSEAMKCGSFRQYSDVHFAVLNGKAILVNGQHTLNAIHESKVKQTLCLHFQRVTSDQEVECLYSKFDNGRRRSSRDSMGSIGDELNFNSKEVAALSVAVKQINMAFSPCSGNDKPLKIYESKDPEFNKTLMREWKVEAAVYFSSINKATKFNKEVFLRGAIVAVGLITIRHQKTKAIPFWDEAAKDDGLRKNDPRKTLLNWLRENGVGQYGRLQHRAAIACWNAWFEDRALERVYPSTDKALRISGANIDLALI